jgi:hypothetical protein
MVTAGVPTSVPRNVVTPRGDVCFGVGHISMTTACAGWASGSASCVGGASDIQRSSRDTIEIVCDPTD